MSVTGVLAGLAETRKWQEDLYRDLHRNPELSHQEHQTARKVAERLRQFGYDVHEGIGGTGVVGILANGDGARVLMRADMDALPVKEATGLPYASTATAPDANGHAIPVMHACGHDVHVTCLLGAAELLAGARDEWSGTVIALFQPAEELGDGARRMVDDGLAAIAGKPDVALAQHVLAFPAGRLGTCPGPFLSEADSMRVTVYGRGAHGSMPQAAVDPVVLAAMIVLRLQTIVSRELPPGEFAVVTVGSLQAGTKSNVISDHAVIELNIRTYSKQTRDTVLAAIRRIVTAECQAARPGLRALRPVPADQQRRRCHPADRDGFYRLLRRPRVNAAPADRKRGLQRHPDSARCPLLLLGLRRHRPGHLPDCRTGRPGSPRHPG